MSYTSVSSDHEPYRPAHVDAGKMTRDAWLILAFVCGAWIFDAADSTIYSLTIPSIRDEFKISLVAMGWIGTAFMGGAAIGSFAMPYIAERFGRRWGMAGCIGVYSVFTGAVSLAWGTMSVGFARFMTGLGTGGEWPVGAAYLTDVVPARKRGFMMGIMQAGYPIGYFIAGLAFSLLTAAHLGWRFAYCIFIIPGIMAIPVLLMLRESPAWLRMRNAGQRKAAAEGSRTGFRDLLKKENLRSTIRGCVLQFGGNFYAWGINIWYPSALVYDFGLDKAQAAFMTMVVWGFAVFGYLASGYLQDKLGRRVALTFYMAVALLATLALYALKSSGGPVPMPALYAASLILGLTMGEATIRITYTSEIFSLPVRGLGVGFCVGVSKIVVMFCPAILGVVAQRASVTAALVCAAVVGLVVIPALFSGPETAGKQIV